jgi:hypothetical protein
MDRKMERDQEDLTQRITPRCKRIFWIFQGMLCTTAVLIFLGYIIYSHINSPRRQEPQ